MLSGKKVWAGALLASLIVLAAQVLDERSAWAGGGDGRGTVSCQGRACLLAAATQQASAPAGAARGQSASGARGSDSAASAVSGGSGSGAVPCVQHYVPVGPPGGASPGDTTSWYQETCGPGAGTVINVPVGQRPPNASASSSPSAPSVSPQMLAEQARSRLVLPAPVLAMSPSAFQVVNVPTWFWLLGDSWQPKTSTAAVPGESVTATATPVSVEWDPGDGGPVAVCQGPGTPFRRGDDPAARSPDCGHVYRHSSARAAGGKFTVTVTVHWRVAWHGSGQGGVFPGMAATARSTTRVEDVQALVNGHPVG